MGHVEYVERLRIPFWWWIVGFLLVLSIVVAVFAYAPLWVSIVVTILFVVAAVAGLAGYGSLRIRVDDQALQVGRFRLGGRWIAEAEALGPKQATAVLGVGSDHRDFLQTRPYVRGLVRITLADPADPHPHWLVSTRHPERLVAAVNEMARERP